MMEALTQREVHRKTKRSDKGVRPEEGDVGTMYKRKGRPERGNEQKGKGVSKLIIWKLKTTGVKRLQGEKGKWLTMTGKYKMGGKGWAYSKWRQDKQPTMSRTNTTNYA